MKAAEGPCHSETGPWKSRSGDGSGEGESDDTPNSRTLHLSYQLKRSHVEKKCSLAARVECDSNTWHGQEDFFVRLVAGFGFMIFMMILCNVVHCHSGHSNPCTCCSNLSLAACRCEALPVGMLQRDQTITTDVTGLTSCTNCTFDPARLKVYKKCHSHQVGTLAIGLHFGFEYL